MQVLKSELRKQARIKRKLLNDKMLSNERIAENLLNLEEYKNAKTVLIYVSTEEEIKTDEIINIAFSQRKRVAVPFCRDNHGNMDFYLIKSLSELKIGIFNVREPDIDKSEFLNDFCDTVNIVPGLMFDSDGYRIGYGKGYYDKFLERYSGTSIGLCFDEMIISDIPRDNYDKNVDIIVTQRRVIKCNNGGCNG
ncbi:MAG: 5-formyltetrahydrofolate cyclo-ligase [Eubacterium sp.]|nr:5-formyltetrahydrofolate cyclo-ligase [Eubacterium sp.]